MHQSPESGAYDQGSPTNDGLDDIQAYEAEEEADGEVDVQDPALNSGSRSSPIPSTESRDDGGMARAYIPQGKMPMVDGTGDHHPVDQALKAPPGLQKVDDEQLRRNRNHCERIMLEQSSQAGSRQDEALKGAATSTLGPPTVSVASVGASTNSFNDRIAGVSTWTDLVNLFAPNGPGPTLYGDDTHYKSEKQSELASSIPNTTLEQVYMESQQQKAVESRLDLERLLLKNGPGPTLYDDTHHMSKGQSELTSSIPDTCLEQVHRNWEEQKEGDSGTSRGAGR